MVSRFERDRPHVNVGTIGHSQTGKTTLTAAITKVLAGRDSSIQVLAVDQIDKEGEEKARRMTINANHVEYQTPKRHYAHVDCPGHVEYVRNMFVGAAQMDSAILVVSATDGIQAQTREHIMLARQAGINYIAVFLNKCDMIEEIELLDLVEVEIRELLNKYRFDGDNCPIIRGSALKALEGDAAGVEAVEKLMHEVDNYFPEPERAVDKPFLMHIAEAFTIGGRGVVVTGRIEQGVVKVGDAVEIVGKTATKTTVVTGVEAFKKTMDQGQAGDHVGLLLRGITREEVSRDHALAKPGSVTPRTKFLAETYVLDKREGGRDTPFFKGYKPQFYFSTADMLGTIKLPEGTEMVLPGDNSTFEVELISPVAIHDQMRFAIRDSNRTVAAGVVVKVLG